jgi:hypothetical protein
MPETPKPHRKQAIRKPQSEHRDVSDARARRIDHRWMDGWWIKMRKQIYTKRKRWRRKSSIAIRPWSWSWSWNRHNPLLP